MQFLIMLVVLVVGVGLNVLSAEFFEVWQPRIAAWLKARHQEQWLEL